MLLSLLIICKQTLLCKAVQSHPVIMNHSSKNIMQNHMSCRPRTMHSHSYLYSSDCFATPWKWWSAFAHTLSVSYKKKRKNCWEASRWPVSILLLTVPHAATKLRRQRGQNLGACWLYVIGCCHSCQTQTTRSGNGDRERCVCCKTALLMAHNHISVKQCVKTALAPSSTGMNKHGGVFTLFIFDPLAPGSDRWTNMTDTWSVAQSEVSKQLYMYGKQKNLKFTPPSPPTKWWQQINNMPFKTEGSK